MSEKIDIEQVDGIGALESLTTTDKSNLVNAINEVNSNSSKRISTTINQGNNWYRIAKGTVSGGIGCSFIIIVERSYGSTNNESYTFSVNTAYNGKTTITQLSGTYNTRILTHLRVVNTTADGIYVDIKYNATPINTLFVRVLGSGEAIPATIAPEVTTGVTELATTNGVITTDNIFANNRVGSVNGFEISGRTNNDIVLAGGGHRPVSDFALANGANLTNIQTWRDNLDVYSKAYINANFHKLAKTNTEATTAGYYNALGNTIDANNILGNVSAYTNTFGGVAKNNSHVISFGLNNLYGFQLVKEAGFTSTPLSIRFRNNGNWSEENFAYQSWVTQQITNAGGNYVPYTGANQPINLNTQSFSIGGNFEKRNTTFEKSYLTANTTDNIHFTRLTDVASFSRGNDSTTQSDCIVITLPIRTSTRWVMEVDMFDWGSSSAIFSGIPTKLLISAYWTNNINRSVTAISNADNVKSVSFCRDSNNNTIIIIRPKDDATTSFSYGKANIANFYHGVTYNSALADKSNYSVEAVLESSLTGLSTQGTITNAQFTRDSYLWNKGNFNPAQYVMQSSLITQLANYVPINGVTTINNTKTFTSSPIVPNATLDSHAVNLGQLNTILDDYATVAEFDNTLKKNESNEVTQDFEITNDYVTVKLNNYGAIHGKSSGLNEIQLGGDAGFAVRYSTSYGDSFDATPYEVQGIANGKYWTLKNDNEVVSIMRMPETGPTNRVLALGAKFGASTYYANTQGIINIPGYTAGTGISIASNVITNTAPNATHTGDVTGATYLTIANNAVTNTKMAQMNANSIKGRAGSNGNPQDLTPAQVRTMLNVQEGANRTRIGINGGNYSEVGDINLIAGSNVSLSKSGGNITISSSSSSVNTTVKAYLPGEVFDNDTIHCSASKTIIYLAPTFAGPLNIAIEPDLQDGSELNVIHTYGDDDTGLFNINGSFINITGQFVSIYTASMGKRYRFIYVKDIERFALVDGGQI